MTLGLVCDACDTLSPLSATLCSVCGAALGSKSVPGPTSSPRSCPNCASEIPGQHRFCGFCGTRTDGVDLRPVWHSGITTKTRLTLVGQDGQEGLSFPLTEGEKITVVLPLTGDKRSFPANQYVFMATSSSTGTISVTLVGMVTEYDIDAWVANDFAG